MPVFWLGLMALLALLRQLGWVAGPGRIDVAFEDLVTPVTGVILLDSALAGEWEVFGNALSPPDPAGVAPRLLLARLHQPA